MAKGSIPMHALIFFCRLYTKSLHIIFSYTFTSLSNYIRGEKTLSRWFIEVSNEIYVGVPPILDNIQTEPQKVKFSVDSMFVKKIGIIHNTKLKQILDASVKIFHSSLLEIIWNEPSGKYKVPTYHPFNNNIRSFLSDNNIQW